HPLPTSFLPPLPLPDSTLFPYTTLFRSVLTDPKDEGIDINDDAWREALALTHASWKPDPARGRRDLPTAPSGKGIREARKKLGRSEEHTSELQSRENLVCRLLLEKKKKK